MSAVAGLFALAVLAAAWWPKTGEQPSALVLGALVAGLVLLVLTPRGRTLRLLVTLGLWNALLIAALGLMGGGSSPAFWLAVASVWLGAWALVERIAAARNPKLALLPPFLFGVTILWLWETTVQALGVPRVILPAPSQIGGRLLAEVPTLAIDLMQTFGRGALSGFAIGCGAAFLFALVVDRYAPLRRGLLPVGNFLAALPIIGTAPIFVMWFGFDWPSKAAVVVAMVFFPMLVNTVQGLASTDRMQRDLMQTWSASWWQTLAYLRLPAAMPFVFNGLKICATLALIGAIVAEFFGSPTYGMGFRISTEVGRLQLDMVWAEIAVAALLGSLFYGFWALVERRVTFWHPSQRGR